MKVINLILLATLTSCSSHYQRASQYYAEGFIDVRIGRDAFKVTYNGSPFTDLHTAVDFCLLRCAEITLERGFTYFRVTKDTAGISQYLVKNPDVYGTINGNPVKISGAYTEGIPRAVATNIIVCRNEVPAGEKDFMNAKQIKTYIREKHSK